MMKETECRLIMKRACKTYDRAVPIISRSDADKVLSRIHDKDLKKAVELMQYKLSVKSIILRVLKNEVGRRRVHTIPLRTLWDVISRISKMHTSKRDSVKKILYVLFTDREKAKRDELIEIVKLSKVSQKSMKAAEKSTIGVIREDPLRMKKTRVNRGGYYISMVGSLYPY